ncbi:MAG: PepSY-associated TM helix domain-containing protein [Rhodopirellula sp. JB055]|uniref:PepSY-associated TM helix domain-containing protein n=1 Tax=Rhodopirellula sp. JB055 TaxID=3342846 RepID=UPI00370CEFCE
MSESPIRKKRSRSLYSRSAAAFRWLHIYLSMLGFTSLMFFAFTGITLNHPTWLGASEQVIRDESGQLAMELLRNEPDKLEIAETLRETHALKGRVKEFEVDDFECMLVYKSPGYAADVFIDRDSGNYSLTETTSNAFSVMNDLHKGRDSGTGWSWLIDISALLMLLMSLSGFGLLLYLKKRRVSGILAAVAGTVAMLGVWVWLVP